MICLSPPVIVGLQCICSQLVVFHRLSATYTLFVLPPVNSRERTSDGFCDVDLLFTSQRYVSFHQSSSACNSFTQLPRPSSNLLFGCESATFVLAFMISSQRTPGGFCTESFSRPSKLGPLGPFHFRLLWCVFAPLTALHRHILPTGMCLVPVAVDLNCILLPCVVLLTFLGLYIIWDAYFTISPSSTGTWIRVS